MHDFVPQFGCVNLFLILRIIAHGGVLLSVFGTINDSFHEIVINSNTHVGTGNLAFLHLGIDERLRIWVLDAHSEHEGSTTSVLSHFASGVAVALHERHKASGSEGRVLYWRSLGADVRKVVSHATATFHELDLLFINLDDAAVGIGFSVNANDKAVRQRANLVVVANACHRTALWHDVSEMLDEVKDLFFRHRVGVLFLNACNLFCNAVVHVVGCLLKDVPEGIFEGIFAHPYARSQFITFEVFECSLVCFLVGVSLFVLHLVKLKMNL